MDGTGLIEAYLAQLRGQLPRRFDADAVLAEVEDHLRTIVEAHLSLGLDEDTAVRHAVGAFGSADLVARAFGQQQGHALAVPTTFTAYAGAAAMVGGVVLGILLTVVSVTTLDTGPSSDWLSPIATASAILALVGLLGIHARHRALYGFTGRIAQLLVPIGMIGVVASAATWFAPGLLVFLVATVLGLIGLGIEVWRGGVVPRTAVALAGLGVVGIPSIVVVGSESEPWSAATLFGMTVSWLIGAGLAWLGHGLWRERLHLDFRGGRSRPTGTV